MDFEKIVTAYFEGRLGESEKAVLLKSLKEDTELRKLFYSYKLIYDISGTGLEHVNAQTDGEWAKTAQEIKPDLDEIDKKEKVRPLISLLRYAAILILGAGIAYLGFFIINNSKPVGNCYSENEIIVSKGQKSQVILADGTKVWLNSDTRFRYPSGFMGDKYREVYLEGEAYFEVTRQNGLPFIVKTGNLNITVLGTAFNVKCYPLDKTVETTLIEGSVSLKGENKPVKESEVILRPNQKAVFSKSDGNITVSDLALKADMQEGRSEDLKQMNAKEAVTAISWKEQVLDFDNESFGEIVVKLERWYGYTIVVKDNELLKHRYRGRFANYETIYQVLDAIKLTTPIKYTVSNKNIIIEKIQE